MTRLELRGAGLCVDSTWLIRSASLVIESGRLTALVGPNGAGKSTLLRLLAGLWRPTEGEVRLEDRPLHRYSRRELARRVTFVPQETRLEFPFLVREIVAMGRHTHVGRLRGERERDRRAVQSALVQTDTVHLSERAVTELSGGERQRVLLARSLATEAPIVLLDEPTANLDVDHSLELLELCHSLATSGHAVVMALHDLNAVWRYADRAVMVHAGRVVARGRPAEVLDEKRIHHAFGVLVERVVSDSGTSLLVFSRPGERSEASSGVARDVDSKRKRT